jgi:hypothetical protein
MSWGSADDLHRTGKIMIDKDKAKDPAEAERFLSQLVLQIAVGPDLEHDHAAQAALATVVNVGRRAFHGGVCVRLDTDPSLRTGWTDGFAASAVVSRYGGAVVDQLQADLPTVVIGNPRDPVGQPLLYCTWGGWTGGVVESPDRRLNGPAIVPAGILSGALGVSEVFQQALGNPVPGRREVGISLWRPDQDWRSAPHGPTLEYLPAALWLLGLGHLGQANAWTLGMLPYANPSEVELGLLDFDIVIKGNIATQLLVGLGDIGSRKTRVVAAALEQVGLGTRIVERAFDESFHPQAHAVPTRNEPRNALAGFDDVTPRRQLESAGFDRVVDAGLGAGPHEYLDMLLHTFPSVESPATAFKETPRARPALAPAYESEITRQIEGGMEESVARCGLLEFADVTVGAAFVGVIASTVAVADILRLLHGGNEYSVVALDLRAPDQLSAVPNTKPSAGPPPPYTAAA